MLVEKLSRGKSHEAISQSRKRACPPDSQWAGALSLLLGSTPCLLHRPNPIDCTSQGPLPCPHQFCIDPLYKAQAKRNDWCGRERGVAQCGEPHPTALDYLGLQSQDGGAALPPAPLQQLRTLCSARCPWIPTSQAANALCSCTQSPVVSSPCAHQSPRTTGHSREIQIPRSEQMPSTTAAFTVEATNRAAPRKLPCWFQILFSAMRMQRQPPVPTYGNDTSIPISFSDTSPIWADTVI